MVLSGKFGGKKMDRRELENFINEKMDTALGQYYYGLEQKNKCRYDGDITSEQSLLWDELVSKFSDLFETLAEQNKKEDWKVD